MGPAATLAILVKVDGATKAAQQVRGLDSDLDRTGKRGAKSFSVLKGAAAGFAGVAAFQGLTKGLGAAIGEYEEARKVAAQTNNVIKSTGGVANVSAKHVSDLAGAISKKVGIDDEAIQSGANLLLTFKNVRNEAGKGGKVFDAATKAAVDLSAAGFGSLESTSKQLGKALNDPIKGISALSRSGVTFSEDQKKVIAALMETGKASDRVKAQQMILKEVNSQVGGSAAAQATAMDKLKVTLGNVAETVGSYIVPALEKAAAFVTKFIDQMSAGEGAGGKFRDVIVQAFETVKGAVGAAVETIRIWFSEHRADVEKVKQAVQNLGDAIVFVFENWVLPVIKRVLPAIKQIVEGTFKAIGGAVKVLTGILTLDFGQAWDGVKDIFEGGVKAAWGVLRAGTASIREAISIVAGVIGDGFAGAWEAVKSGLRGLVGWLGDRVDDLKKVGEKLSRPFVAAFEAMAGAVKEVLGFVKDLVGAVKDAVGWIGKIKIPKIDLPFGGSGNGTTVGPGNTGLLNNVQQIADYSLQWGLSGGRGAGQAFRPGDDGWHGRNRARDLSGPAAKMMAFAQMLKSTVGPRLLELIYSPMGVGIKNGRPVDIRSFFGESVYKDHFDHVHVAMAKGGYLKRGGWAVVGEKGPELAHLPTGASVYSNKDSKGMLGGGGPLVHIENAQFGGAVDVNAMAERLAFRIATA